MIRRILPALAVAGLLAVAVADTGAAPIRGASRTVPMGPGPVVLPATAVHATNALALRLLPRLGGRDNVVFSPYSIETALAMVDQGAAGSTASEIARVLGGNDAAALARPNTALANSLRASVTAPSGSHATDAARLLIANGIWVQRGLALEQPFTTTLATDFGAAPQAVDFNGDSTGARQAINGWIAVHTAGLIRNLMGPAAITPQTALVLANAIYLKARWATAFDTSATAPAAFATAGGRSVRATFMSQSDANLRYARGKGYVAVDLPYLNSDLSLLAVMPTAGTIAAFERSLRPPAFGRLVDSLRDRLVDLRMPKLRLRLQTNLNAALSRLGMPAAFSDSADFSGITHAAALKIQAVQHAADLRIDEAGTVAAAATGISLTPTAAAPGFAAHVTLNHPYLLFLRDDDTGAILFAARVVDPSVD